MRIGNIFRAGAQAIVGWLTKSIGLPPGWIMRDEAEYLRPDGKTEIPPTSKAYMEQYNKAIWVYTCVSRKARYCANVPWLLKRVQDEAEDEVVAQHPSITLLERPQKDLTFQKFIELLIIYLELSGRAFVEKAPLKGDEGTIGGLFHLLPHLVKPIVDSHEGITEYVYRPNQNEISIAAENVIYIRYPDPMNEHSGVGAMSAAWMSAMLDSTGRGWNAKFFQRGGGPELILTTNKPIAPAERERMETEFRNRYTGTGKSRGVAVLPPDVGIQNYGQSARDMQFDRLMRMTREEIMAAFGVPPVLVGLSENTNYATANIQLQVFRDYIVVPLMQSVFDAITIGLIEPHYEDGPELYMAVNTEAMLTPQEREAESTSVVMKFDKRLITKNEARAKIGYPAVDEPGADTTEAPAQGVQPGVEDAPQGVQDAPEAGDDQTAPEVAPSRPEGKLKAKTPPLEAPGGRDLRKSTNGKLRTAWDMEKASRSIESKIEPSMAEAMRERLKAQRQAVIDLIKAKFDLQKAYDENQPRDASGKWTSGGGGSSSSSSSSSNIYDDANLEAVTANASLRRDDDFMTTDTEITSLSDDAILERTDKARKKHGLGSQIKADMGINKRQMLSIHETLAAMPPGIRDMLKAEHSKGKGAVDIRVRPNGASEQQTFEVGGAQFKQSGEADYITNQITLYADKMTDGQKENVSFRHDVAHEVGHFAMKVLAGKMAMDEDIIAHAKESIDFLKAGSKTKEAKESIDKYETIIHERTQDRYLFDDFANLTHKLGGVTPYVENYIKDKAVGGRADVVEYTGKRLSQKFKDKAPRVGVTRATNEQFADIVGYVIGLGKSRTTLFTGKTKPLTDSAKYIWDLVSKKGFGTNVDHDYVGTTKTSILKRLTEQDMSDDALAMLGMAATGTPLLPQE